MRVCNPQFKKLQQDVFGWCHTDLQFAMFIHCFFARAYHVVAEFQNEAVVQIQNWDALFAVIQHIFCGCHGARATLCNRN